MLKHWKRCTVSNCPSYCRSNNIKAIRFEQLEVRMPNGQSTTSLSRSRSVEERAQLWRLVMCNCMRKRQTKWQSCSFWPETPQEDETMSSVINKMRGHFFGATVPLFRFAPCIPTIATTRLCPWTMLYRMWVTV